jgi:hypothetical protein
LSVLCSGTLISSRFVLTAAHCFAHQRPGTVYEVVFADKVDGSTAEFHYAREVHVHPAFDPTTHEADLALLRLDEASGTAPVAFAPVGLDQALVGESVRMVGFGQSDPSVAASAGLKKQALSRVSRVDSVLFRSERQTGMTCEGDSGGPVFLTTGGHEQIGLTSSGDSACVEYADNIRIDAYTEFIRGWLDSEAGAAPATISSSAICASECVRSEDCPAGFECAPTSDGHSLCTIGGPVAGELGASCRIGADCGSSICARTSAADGPDACRCYAPCAGEDARHARASVATAAPASPGTAGCAIAAGGRPSSSKSGLGLLIGLVGAAGLRRRATRRRGDGKVSFPSRQLLSCLLPLLLAVACSKHDGDAATQTVDAFFRAISAGDCATLKQLAAGKIERELEAKGCDSTFADFRKHDAKYSGVASQKEDGRSSSVKLAEVRLTYDGRPHTMIMRLERDASYWKVARY